MIRAVLIVVAAAAVTWRYPLFHVVPLEVISAQQDSAAFDAAKFAEEFWTTRLTPHFDSAADAGDVLAALQADPAAARQKFGRTVGVSRTAFFLVRGSGRIVTVEKRRIGVALNEESSTPALWIAAGPIFGNAVRDASGLLRAGDFANSQHFNALAAELNRLVEERVVPQLVEIAAPGKGIQFVCCLEASSGATLLKAIPLQIAVN